MPDGSIIVFSEAKWTLSAENPGAPGNRYVEVNGQRLGDASGSRLEVCNGKVMVYGRLGNWWTYDGGWIDSGSAVLPCKVP
jgi:hypothetical protein